MAIKTSLLMFAGFFVSTGAHGATIDLSTLLGNPSFELGNQADGCPVDWTCTGSPTPGFWSYAPTSAQYTPGSDGLASGVAPLGSHVASSPTFIEGSGTISQTNLGFYQAGVTYDLNLWIGTPATLPADGVTPTAQPGRIEIYFTGTGTSGLESTDAYVIPDPGEWILETFSFTPDSSQAGQPIGIDIFLASDPPSGGSGNNRVGDFDIDSTTGITAPPLIDIAPEPGTFMLIGASLISVSFFRVRRR